MKYPYRTVYNAFNNQLKFPQIQGSILLEKKLVLDKVEYEHEARGLKSLKISTSVGAMKVQSRTNR